MATPEARRRSAARSGWGPKPPRSPRQKVASAPRRPMSASTAPRARSFAYTPPNTASRVLISSVPAGHAGHLAGVAGAVTDREAAQRVGQARPHARAGLVHQQRAHEHAAAGHGAAAPALQSRGVERLGRQAREGLGGLVVPVEPDLAPEPEERQHLEARARDPGGAQQPEVALAEAFLVLLLVVPRH